MLDVRKLSLLCDLERLGTIAAVAQARTYTPSAVSQQLSALERETGLALLERTGRRVTFTPAGRVLARHAATVLAALEETGAALAALRTGPAGPLRIGAFPTAVRTLLPPALVALGREHPALELMVTEVDPADAPAALRERRLDVALLTDYDVAPGDVDPDLDSVPLLDETVFLAVPAAGDCATLGDARDQPWILASEGTQCHEATLRACAAHGYTPRVRHRADDFATVLALVGAGQGVSLVPGLAAGQATGVRLVALSLRRRTRIAYRKGAAGHPSVAALVATLTGG
ncbi:LysR family transcriptional regulator [Actinoplanes cyaneus]|uniref:LysR family transcriptional regulator n=1 Tax=Actinoplanes cyaneus TaxID=52696 RepID=A0A919IS73_9ACTN|nr:LysR family transcriptional regulator [Actinoplanes cyaneus]MCW2143140.1 DNA-binding transcriptional regulator, LysR family [Actinoplanes cyaneus]GID70473.1 LysR family transcriptional regulator [Actinoplanes cyaneus]